MNILRAAAVLPDMCAYAQNGKPRQVGHPQDDTRNTTGGRRRWRPRRRRDRGQAHRPPAAGTEDGQAMAGAMQMAIGLLTAGLDSAELEEWAVQALIPEDPAALADFLAGLYVVSRLLLRELQQATGQPAAGMLQRLAILGEPRNGTPSVG